MPKGLAFTFSQCFLVNDCAVSATQVNDDCSIGLLPNDAMTTADRLSAKS